MLIVEGKPANILNVKSEAGLEIKADFELNDRALESEEIELFEVMVLRDSRLDGQNLKTVNFRQIYDLTIRALSPSLSLTPRRFLSSRRWSRLAFSSTRPDVINLWISSKSARF